MIKDFLKDLARQFLNICHANKLGRGACGEKQEMVRAASHSEGHIGEQHTERGPTVTRNRQMNASRQE